MSRFTRYTTALALLLLVALPGCSSKQTPSQDQNYPLTGPNQAKPATPAGTPQTPTKSTPEQEKKTPLTDTPSQPAELHWADAPKSTVEELNAAAVKGYDLLNAGKAQEAYNLLKPLAGAKHREVQIALGVAAYNVGKHDEAAECYRRAQDVDPKSAVAANNLGNVYRDQKKYDLGLTAYQKAIENDPSYLTAVTNLASLLQGRGRPAWAAEVLTNAIAKNPKSGDLHIQLGRLQTAQQLWKEARATFEAALKIDPNNLQAKAGLDALPK